MKKKWAWGSILGMAATIAIIATAWPQFSAFVHWQVSMMDAPERLAVLDEKLNEVHIEQQLATVEASNQFYIINFRLDTIYRRLNIHNAGVDIIGTGLPVYYAVVNP